MTIALQSASLYEYQEVFMWSSCLLDLGTDFLASNGLQDAKYLVNSFLPLVYVDGGFASLHRQDRQPCLTPV